MDTPQHTTGRGTALQKDKSQAHPSGSRNQSPIQEAFTRHWLNPTHERQTPQLQGTIQPSSMKKGDSKHSQLNKMKIQRSMQQIKQHGKKKTKKIKQMKRK